MIYYQLRNILLRMRKKKLVIMNAKIVIADFPIFIAASIPDFHLLHIRYMVQQFTLYFADSQQLIIIYCNFLDIWWLLHSKTLFCCMSAFQISIAAFPILLYFIPGIWCRIPKYYFDVFPIICVYIPDFYCYILHYLLFHSRLLFLHSPL